MRFRAVPIAGDTRVNIVVEGFPGTVALNAHGNLGRELVRLANAGEAAREELEREELEREAQNRDSAHE